MSPHIAELAELANVPVGERRSYDWPAIEADLLIRLPAEYKEYVSYFPPGGHGGIGIFHPAARGNDVNGLGDQVRICADLYTGLAGSRPGAYTFYPEPGGLIPWATYESTTTLCWLPNGDDPDAWPVVAYNDENQHETVPGTTVEALLRVLREESARSVFPDFLYEDLRALGRFRFTADDSPRNELGPIADHA